ncbi:hypothetical protein POV26_10380 [Aequorivita todarodis]|uniref:hypothetical protein n=1 Tax=Aequorivita todarodis TaxID=2036821 RepID=UPI0023501EE5|nr:hypothetical protein [Aequorivita todarodis]MDC8001448.1 hypothetical protein [Aequorivita todarodis]
MKNYLLIFAILGTISITSCKNETKKENSEGMAPQQADIVESDVNSPEIACYRYVSKKDTVLLQMEKMNDEVAGTLSYNYFEKDKSDGTFEGKMVGDTLFADYTFGSEGTLSVREVMFLKKGNKLVEGFGEVEAGDGKMKFKNNTEFTLNDAMPLEEINCDEN